MIWSAGPRIAVCVRHLRPYQRARLRAASARAPLAAIEVCSIDQAHGQKRDPEPAGFDKVTLFHDAEIRTNGRPVVRRRIARVLAQLDPTVVVVPGWSDPVALAALEWSSRRGKPTVLMSESTAYDERRRWWREALKRRIVALGSAALAGGALQSAYLRTLGLPDDAIFFGYDAVDNTYFADRAADVRNRVEAERGRLRLPEHFFLASGRFVAKKNLVRLVRAYGHYRRAAGAAAWPLVLLGDGALRPRIEAEVRTLGLDGAVHLPGFKQYGELPAYYALASAFVHASTTEQWGLVVNEAMASGLPAIVSERCGCAPDLVQDGVNGFTFDPYDVDELAGLMAEVAAMTDERRQAMGHASQRIIADWGPERFADGLMQAVQVAMRRPPPKASWLDQALLWPLTHR